ncbi:methyl-accepting chemotaxis protein [Catenovulum sediminis]|uniref:Methyl-accepting chemotaxis protein n=2 Tax=Catenovulum sediminis TaxID=1740262 RepID=A0ABV1RE64_9ALTE|nr:methyl-accepting chemotaxis protein [Catenovulum sediminis]
MLSLKGRVWLLVIVILGCFLALSSIALYTLKVASDSDNKSRVKQLFQSTYSTITSLEKMVSKNQLAEAQAKEIAIHLLRNNIYHKSEYVYVADEKLIFLATPLDPQLHGTSFHAFKDSQGNSVGEILFNAVASQSGEIAEYHWTQRQADGSVEGKLSIAQRTPKWGWYVGTGIGFDEVNQRFWSTARWQLGVCIALSVLIAALLMYATKGLLTLLGGEPKDVLKLVRLVAAGDLSSNRSMAVSDDNSILGSTISMRNALSKIVTSLALAVENLHKQTHNSEERINRLNINFAKQRSETDMVATAMTEMAMSSQTVSESASNAAQAANQADAKSVEAMRVVATSVDKISELSAQIQDSHKAIAELGNDVNNIVVVLDVIKGIAEQTNLLALNAAIEAARAGEDGRGFAVVADEVRGLAKRTQDSTTEIQSMITRLEQGAQKAQESMNASMAIGHEAVDKVKKTHASLDEISNSINTITEMNNQIATAAEEQNQVGEDISRRINQISESAAQVAEISNQGKESTHQLVTLTDELDRNLQYFQLNK